LRRAIYGGIAKMENNAGARKEPKPIAVFITAPFKIHNPSKRKRAMILDAMKRAHLAYSKALDAFKPRAEAGEFNNASTDELAQHIIPMLRPLPLAGAAKDGVAEDLAGGITAWRELRDSGAQKNARLSSASPIKETEQDFAAVWEIVRTAETVEQTDRARDELNRSARAGKLRPLSFVRHSKDKGFLLLRAKKGGRYCCFFNLHEKPSRFAKHKGADKKKEAAQASKKTAVKKAIKPGKAIEAVSVDGDAKVKFNTQTGDIFPLEYGGHYQIGEFLRRRNCLSCVPKSAKLIWRREGDYFEALITFAVKVKRIAADNYLGVDRGCNNLAAMCAIDPNGGVISRGAVSGEKLRTAQKAEEEKQKRMQRRGREYHSRRRAMLAESEIHTAANQIVNMAQTARARVVLENLAAFSKGASKSGGWRGAGLRRMMGRRQFARLAKTLEYKLKLAGLPPPLEINPAYTSQTCGECGFRAKENRAKPGDDFCCRECGHRDDGDKNAARVIALKRIWLYTPRRDKEKFRALSQSGFGFDAFIRALRVRRSKMAS
jgi:IS605 OrfB family transposase